MNQNTKLMMIAAGAFLLLSMGAKRPAVAATGRPSASIQPTNNLSDMWRKMGIPELARALTQPTTASASSIQARAGIGSTQGLFGGADWWRPIDLTTGRAITAETDQAGIGFDPTSSGPGLSLDPSRYGTGVRFGAGDLNSWLNLSNDGAGDWTSGGLSGGGGGLRSSSMYGLRVGEVSPPGTDFTMAASAEPWFTSVGSDVFYNA